MSRAERRANPPTYEEDDNDDEVVHAAHLLAQLEGQNTNQHGAQEEAQDKYSREDVPPYACRYCLHHDPASVVRCGKCNLWFCNGKQPNMHTSHIVHHLRTAGHDSVHCHPEGSLGDGAVECYVCGSDNVFALGYTLDEQRQALITCREGCMFKTGHDGQHWKEEDWVTVVDEGSIRRWVANDRSPEDAARCREISRDQMRKLERLWKSNPAADVADLASLAESRKGLERLPLNFKDGEEYVDSFGFLLKEELHSAKQSSDRSTIASAHVQFSRVLTGSVASLTVPRGKGKFHLGGEVCIVAVGRNPNDITDAEQRMIGTVSKVVDGAGSEHVEVLCRGRKPWDNGNYTVQVNFNAIIYKRMLHAMNTMLKDENSISSSVYNTILGSLHNAKKLRNIRKPEDLDVPTLHTLNMSQQKAIYSALDSPVALIQGPPGTGKTQTSASLVYHLAKLHKAQILVTAPSNTAVDNLALRIAQSGLNVVRVFAKSREELESNATGLGLHTLIRKLAARDSQSTLAKWLQLKDETGYLSDADQKKFIKVLAGAEEDILSVADVICTTCVGAGDRRLAPYRFRFVLIDEATQAVEPETLIPMTCGAKQVILVGDHCQMGPVVDSKQVELAGLGRSMFERLVLLGAPCARLEIQYRMHPFIAQFSNKYFYESALTNGVTASDRKPAGEFPWPDGKAPSIFWNCSDGAVEEIGSTGKSYLNRAEGALVIQAIQTLLSNRVKPCDIGVVTPYNAQRFYIMDTLERVHGAAHAGTKVEVASVDSFQGREKEFIILTCVRASDSQGIGFLNSWQRLNVALTRARKGVIVIGNAPRLVKYRLWARLIEHYSNNGVLVEGQMVNALSRCAVEIPDDDAEGSKEQIGPAQPRQRRHR